jgi:hypothetical protein
MSSCQPHSLTSPCINTLPHDFTTTQLRAAARGVKITMCTYRTLHARLTHTEAAIRPLSSCVAADVLLEYIWYDLGYQWYIHGHGFRTITCRSTSGSDSSHQKQTSVRKSSNQAITFHLPIYPARKPPVHPSTGTDTNTEHM